MTSTSAQNYFDLSKEELLQQDPEVLNQLRQQLGDQEFIDQWKLTQEEYSYLINGLEELEVSQTTKPVEVEKTVQKVQPVATTHQTQSTPLGVREVLYATRRGGATTLLSSTVVATEVKEASPVRQVLTTSSYVAAPEVSSNVWRSEVPAYSIIRHAPTQIQTVVVNEPVTVVNSGVRYLHSEGVPTTSVLYGGYPYNHTYGYNQGYLNGSSYVVSNGYPTTQYIGDAGLRTSYVTRGDALPLRGSVIRGSYAGPARASYVHSAPLRTSYVGASRLV